MARINCVPAHEATGIVKEGYDMFQARVGAVPRPFELLSCSPDLFGFQLARVGYYANHPKLSFALLAHIRYLAAYQLNYPFCLDFNRHILGKLGLSDKDIAAMEEDPKQAMLEEHETAMLDFVIRSMQDPTAITDGDFARLRELDWDDRDMVDALSQGVSMIDHAIMMEVFQMDQNCLIEK